MTAVPLHAKRRRVEEEALGERDVFPEEGLCGAAVTRKLSHQVLPGPGGPTLSPEDGAHALAHQLRAAESIRCIEDNQKNKAALSGFVDLEEEEGLHLFSIHFIVLF